jgi:hypothetical protein
LIGLGWALLGLVALDQGLQYRQEQESQERFQLLTIMQQEANDQNQAKWDTTLPTLFECKIIHTEASLDGTKMLRHVRVGDVIQVLEADIGPDQAYHLCRHLTTTSDNKKKKEEQEVSVSSMGWYPIQYLQKL